MKPFPRCLKSPRSLVLSLSLLFSLCLTADTSADIVHDFSATPIIWVSSAGALTWDADGDEVADFQVAAVSGFVDTVSGLYAIDNFSTHDLDIEKTLVFSFTSLNPQLADTEIALLGFNFYSEKNIEVGGSGGAGSITVDVFDDVDAELVNGITVSGNLGSNPSRVDIPGTSQSHSFEITVNLDSPPSNNHAQVVIGDIVFNGGTLRAFSAVPEPSGLLALMAGCGFVAIRKRRKQREQ